MSLLTLSPVENLVNTQPEGIPKSRCGKTCLVGYDPLTKRRKVVRMFCHKWNCEPCQKRRIKYLADNLVKHDHLVHFTAVANTVIAEKCYAKFTRKLRNLVTKFGDRKLEYCGLGMGSTGPSTIFLFYIEAFDIAEVWIEKLWKEAGGELILDFKVLENWRETHDCLQDFLKLLNGHILYMKRMRTSRGFFGKEFGNEHSTYEIWWAYTPCTLESYVKSLTDSGEKVITSDRNYWLLGPPV